MAKSDDIREASLLALIFGPWAQGHISTKGFLPILAVNMILNTPYISADALAVVA